MAKRELTEKQQLFLDVLFEEAEGDPLKAKKLAGYSDNVPTSSVTTSLIDEIAELTRKFIAQSSTKAAYTMFKVMGDTDMLGAKERMAAAKDLMDRAGFVKTEKVEVSSSEPVFILPAKKREED
jgi:hypothetical protein|tara:strand:+ start:3229 stop:3600 length:372 start_codon:yes stop_codon:yes gene_type:complete